MDEKSINEGHYRSHINQQSKECIFQKGFKMGSIGSIPLVFGQSISFGKFANRNI